MLLITGATGNLGASVVRQLLKISSSVDFIVTSSSQAGVEKLTSEGLQARLANFNDANSLENAFQGVTKILLISTMEQNRFEQQKQVIDIAKAQGVKHIIYTSVSINDIQKSGVKDLMLSHFQTEDYLKQVGLTYTILRNTIYADAITQFIGTLGLENGIQLPAGNGKVPFVLRREMGEATANLLVKGGYENETLEFTSTHLIDFAELAQELSLVRGTPIAYNALQEDVYVKKLKEIGLPDFAIYLHAGTMADIKNGLYENYSAVLEDLLGRKSASPAEFLKEIC